MSNGKTQVLSRFADPVFRRRLAIRIGLGALLAAVGAFSMIVGKGHSIVLDDMRPKDGTSEPVRMALVKVDKQKKAVDLQPGVREIVPVTGQRHTLSVDWMDGTAPTILPVRIAFGQEFVIVSLPKLKVGAESAIEPFFPYEEKPAEAAAPTTVNGEAAVTAENGGAAAAKP